MADDYWHSAARVLARLLARLPAQDVLASADPQAALRLVDAEAAQLDHIDASSLASFCEMGDRQFKGIWDTYLEMVSEEPGP